MKAKISPLQLDNFFLLKYDYKFNALSRGDEISELFNQYQNDIDFAIKKNPSGLYNLFVKISINQSEPILPGYSIFIEGVGVFSIENSSVEQKAKEQLLNISALGICINMLRDHIVTLTAGGPVGKYIFPVIDLNELLKQKSAQKKKTKTPKTS